MMEDSALGGLVGAMEEVGGGIDDDTVDIGCTTEEDMVVGVLLLKDTGWGKVVVGTLVPML